MHWDACQKNRLGRNTQGQVVRPHIKQMARIIQLDEVGNIIKYRKGFIEKHGTRQQNYNRAAREIVFKQRKFWAY